MACGSPGLPEMSRKTKGKYSTLGKRLMSEIVYLMLRKTRSEWLKLDCLNSSFQGVMSPQRKQRLKSSYRCIPESFGCSGNIPARYRMSTRHFKEAKGEPNPTYYVQLARNAGSPTGRESYGDGAPIVVRGRESRLHGEGGQVLVESNRPGVRDAHYSRNAADSTG
jgi:hypothetical protein